MIQKLSEVGAVKVRDIMSTDVLSVAPEMSVLDAAGLLESFDIGSVPVCEDGKPVGVLTDRDVVIRVTARGLDPAAVPVREVMTPHPVTCGPEDDLVAAERAMADARIRRIPVVGPDGKLVGYLSTAKIARSDSDQHSGHLLREISQPGKSNHE